MSAVLLNVGAVPGAFAGPWAMERLGCRNALALSAVPNVTAVASSAAVLQHLRLLKGFAVGTGSDVKLCCIDEVAPVALRGPLGIALKISVTLGTLLVSVAGDYGPVVAVRLVSRDCVRLSLKKTTCTSSCSSRAQGRRTTSKWACWPRPCMGRGGRIRVEKRRRDA